MVHPGLLLISLALLAFFIPLRWSKIVLLLVNFAILLYVVNLSEGLYLGFSYLGFDLFLMRVDGITKVFLIVFSLMALVGLIFAWNQKSKVEICAAMVYAGGALSTVLANDLIVFFIFWEVMALGSTLVIVSNGTNTSRDAALRYAMIHLFGGVLLMAGIAGHSNMTGSIEFSSIALTSIFSYLILIGILINAAAFPISSWLPDAYPEASFSGTVILSAFTTKTAVYSLIRAFPGAEILIFIGVIMVFYGIIYALLENDMRRILSYSIVNQVGFMLVGVGIGTEMSINGTSAHAFAHIIYKALLLMSAGSVLYMTGRSKCTELGGLYQTMPLTMICGVIGAFAISAFPLTSGFVSKSMISQGAADSSLFSLWLLLAAASAGVFLHAGIKFPWFVFFQKDSGLRPSDPPLSMQIAMVSMSFVCIFLGIFPSHLYSILPYEVQYVPYTASHVLFQLQLLLFAGFAFFVMLPWLKRTNTISLDSDWFYRAFPSVIYDQLVKIYHLIRNYIPFKPVGMLRGFTQIRQSINPLSFFGKNWSTSLMVTFVYIILLIFLIFFFIR
ncbi:MAG: Na(+)/H(+) antiporter subunit D [Betaproteobacteria bacterium TMED82]|nr:MAG: Na(+)/H(+) antiporter subunit D [Betaproteobacteria bacterium TMED82]|tara:strand:- start:9067 stop:10740 length:1674 start_codon:yes stop_codon:yes gene_type:complete